MKKLTLTLIALLTISILAIAQTKLYVYQTDGSRTEFLAESIDSITIGDELEIITYDFVDLGLSVKWGTCNVGAKSPDQIGHYFAWGEVEQKTCYDNTTYIWYDGSQYIKYNDIDKKYNLELSDDAANVERGNEWRIPTLEEIKELIENCTWDLVSFNGVNGYNVTSKINNNSIFLPASGHKLGNYLYDLGTYGYYWSSTLSQDETFKKSFYLAFSSSDIDWSFFYDRNDGRVIRPVLP